MKQFTLFGENPSHLQKKLVCQLGCRDLKLGRWPLGWGAGRRQTWGWDCHLLDGIFKLLPAQPSAWQSTTEQAAFVVQAPDVLLGDHQAEDAVARAGVAHPAFCKLRTEPGEFCGRPHGCVCPTLVNKKTVQDIIKIRAARIFEKPCRDPRYVWSTVHRSILIWELLPLRKAPQHPWIALPCYDILPNIKLTLKGPGFVPHV